MRSMMSNHDTADAGLIDITRFNLAELRAHVEESALAAALLRIFGPREEVVHHPFSSMI